MAGRTDLRDTAAPHHRSADARDHDDAVYAEADADPGNKGGFIVIVAIADVAHYVRPGTQLDREAQLRGNSVYFPDRVVPMLPENISNDLCSLREGEERPCLAVRMVFDQHGDKKQPHVPARDDALGGQAHLPGGAGGDRRRRRRTSARRCMEQALKPLWAAYAALAAARDEREPLDLDLPERKIVLDEHGPRRPRRDARAPRRASADRGVHDPGQRRRRRDAGGEEVARRLSRARRAVAGEAESAARLPRHARHASSRTPAR